MIAFFLILIFTWIVTLFMPWWGILIPAIIFGAWLLQKGTQAFITGFLAAGLAWFFHALYIHFANDGILSTRMAEMMGTGSPWVILMITFLVGGIPGGLGALTGFLLKLNLKPSKI